MRALMQNIAVILSMGNALVPPKHSCTVAELEVSKHACMQACKQDK